MAMMSRQVTAFVEPDALHSVVDTLIDEVLPVYCETPHFLGFTVIKSEAGPRTEIVATSYWDDGLEGSAHLSDQFMANIRAIEGVSASRRTFEILYVTMRDTTGGLCADRPWLSSPD
jgi:hypothetical protein